MHYIAYSREIPRLDEIKYISAGGKTAPVESLCRRGETFVESEHARYELADGFQRLLRPVELGRMAGVREHAYLDRAIRLPPRNGDLRRRAVFVILALHDQDRHADVGQIFVDPPVPEIWVEPGPVPAPERHVDVAVILGEPRAQIAGLVSIF